MQAALTINEEKRLSENLATCSKFKVALKICGADDDLLDGVGRWTDQQCGLSRSGDLRWF